MPKHFLILFLIFSILSYSNVWAVDSHADNNSEQSQSHAIDSQPGDIDHELDDDHCCHAGAHLLGLLESENEISLPTIDVNISGYNFRLNNYQNSPPQRPPLS